MKKTLIAEFFTTVSFRQFITALGQLTFRLPSIRYGIHRRNAEVEILKYLGTKNSTAVSCYNGRTAIFFAMKLLKLKKGDEILVNAYTCVSVSNALIQANVSPVYVDIDRDDLSFNIDDLHRKISPKTKVIIIQHTFGKTAKLKPILDIAKKHNIYVIEDIAHSLGSKYKNISHGSFGDFAIISTGRDKVISSVSGGFLIVNNPNFIYKDANVSDYLVNVNISQAMRNIMYNIVGYLSYKSYDFFSLGKVIIHLSRKLGIINEVVTNKEKQLNEKALNYKMPNSAALSAIKELSHINSYIKHRKKIAEFYNQNLEFKYFKLAFEIDKEEDVNYFRYPIVFENEEIAEKYYNYMRKNNILMGNSWSGINIAPKGTNLKLANYKFDCPIAEATVKKILLLPNHIHISIKDAKYITEISNKFTA